MIRLIALDCKLKNLILSVRDLFKQSLKHHPLFLPVCPYCGAKGTCRRRGCYERSLVTFSNGTAEVIRLKIPRVQCPCGRSHALLPDLIVPYLSYSLPMILMILSDHFHRRLTIRGICEKYLVNVPLIYRLKKLFLLHKKQWLGALRDRELCAPDFIAELQTGSYSRFRYAFLRLTTYSFLQSHKNPADCGRPRLSPANIYPVCHSL